MGVLHNIYNNTRMHGTLKKECVRNTKPRSEVELPIRPDIVVRSTMLSKMEKIVKDDDVKVAERFKHVLEYTDAPAANTTSE